MKRNELRILNTEYGMQNEKASEYILHSVFSGVGRTERSDARRILPEVRRASLRSVRPARLNASAAAPC